MLLRLVQAHLAPDQIHRFRAFYDQEVIPVLGRSRGCLFACLASSSRNPERGLSLTFWNRAEDAAEYERSGDFATLLAASRPYFAQSDTLDVRLSEDLRLELTAGAEEPVVSAYLSAADESRSGTEHWCDFLRIVSIHVRPDHTQDLVSLYRDIVIPELRRTPGCCAIHLAQSVSEPHEFISCTIWRTRTDAERYESEGRFRRLVHGISAALIPPGGAPAGRESLPGMLTMTSEDIAVDAYTVATARAFGRRPA
jgi:heme-degrading monooxygenase HmoA